jgi:hypothetical protein
MSERFDPTERRRPARDAITHWAIVEREGRDPEQEPLTGRRMNRCQRCHSEGDSMILHADPYTTDPRRVVCGTCQGKANAELLGRERRAT